MPPAARWFWLIGGPNGAGKTTLARSTLTDCRFVNTDDNAMAIDDPKGRLVAAGRNTLRSITASLATGADVAWETTLSGRSAHIRAIGAARAQRRPVGMIYVGLEDADLAITRVASRVAQGGHHVPDADVRRRYARSLDNLPDAVGLLDVVELFDNSSSFAPYRPIATFVNGVLTLRAPLPPRWFERLWPSA